MSVRRLAPAEVQPAFAFSPENEPGAGLRYPAGKQARRVIPFLMRAQDQEGWSPKAAIETIADRLGMKHIRVLEVATFYTQFQLGPVGSVAHVQVCRRRRACCAAPTRSSTFQAEPHRAACTSCRRTASSRGKRSSASAPASTPPDGGGSSDTYEDLDQGGFGGAARSVRARRRPEARPAERPHRLRGRGGATTLNDPGLYDGTYSRPTS